MPRRNYPSKLAVSGPDLTTVEWVRKTGARHVAELGVYRGGTTKLIAAALPEDGSLDLFDFADTLERVVPAAKAVARCPVRGHGNSHKLLDSYCWSLMRVLREHPEPIWDYVYLDGAHTWAVDGFAFLLCDRLLRPGGYIDFDDYRWTLGKSPSLNPRQFSLTSKLYTREQIRTPQVELVCTLLAERAGYEAALPRKIYQKPVSA